MNPNFDSVSASITVKETSGLILLTSIKRTIKEFYKELKIGDKTNLSVGDYITISEKKYKIAQINVRFWENYSAEGQELLDIYIMV
jgi:small-conductance mechanosensitive channel